MIDKSKTKFLMVASAILLGLLGLSASFFPEELLTYLNAPTDAVGVLLMKLVGGLYIGFALLNWMARSNVIGAIYSRPVAVGNFIHFFVGTIVLTKHIVSFSFSGLFLGLGIAKALLAIAFGYLLFARGKSCQ